MIEETNTNPEMITNTNPEMMQMFRAAIEKSKSAQYRSGAQTAIGAANAIGGVYGHRLQADTALSGQKLQAETAATGQKLQWEVGMANVGVGRANVNLNRDIFNKQQAEKASDPEGHVGSILNNYMNNL